MGTAGATLKGPRLAFVIAALLLATLLGALDQTIVATALPTIAGDLHDLSHLAWVVTAYLLAQTAGDRRRRARRRRTSIIGDVVSPRDRGKYQELISRWGRYKVFPVLGTARVQPGGRRQPCRARKAPERGEDRLRPRLLIFSVDGLPRSGPNRSGRLRPHLLG